jgi:large subunit ribosomal protein L7Ae
MGPKKAQPKPKAAPKASPKAAPTAKAKSSAKSPPAKKGSKQKEPAGKKPVAKAKPKAKPAAKVESGPPTPSPQLFIQRPRSFGIGQQVLPKGRDLTRYVKWPAYVKRQRQKRVLQKRLRVPPAINQFNYTLDRHNKKELFKFALKYKPESAVERRKRLKAEAEAKLKDPKAPASLPPPRLICGAQRVFRMVEQKRAKLVMIAHDVDPIELVICLPALCKKQGVPYCIVKGKANLGQLVGTKTTTCCAFMNVAPSDKPTFDKLCEAVKLSFNERYEDITKKWGGLKLSTKSKQAMAKKRRKLAPKTLKVA